MYITQTTTTSKNKTFTCTLLRESYREGDKVKNRTIANLSHCKPEEIEAIKLALKYKNNLAMLGNIDSVEMQEGLSVGAVLTLYEIAQRLGIEKSLGTDRQGKLALWQVLARVIDQGSRLSATRLAKVHSCCDVLKMDSGFNENDLYENLSWISKNQETIEDKLFNFRCKDQRPDLFLYDVTSSYLEGCCNELADWGYNRDKKSGKTQIVIGLLCDSEGMPVSVEVFKGNTRDMSTFSSQVQKVVDRFGCKRVTFVGDRGMIKSAEVKTLKSVDYHYITAITKPQVKTLLKSGTIQLELFDEKLCDIEDAGVRYILRRNPLRVEETEQMRLQKQEKVKRFVEKRNKYLSEHPRSKVETSLKDITSLIEKLKINSWLQVEVNERTMTLKIDATALNDESLLDGCYVLTTDLPKSCADAKLIHDRYKDLALVEKAFRSCKTGHLEVRPVYVRTDENTRAHVFVVMLAYMLIRELNNAWSDLDITVEEGLSSLSTLCAMEIKIEGKSYLNRIPKPREMSLALLSAVNIKLPGTIRHRNCKVVTIHNLQNHRKD